MKINADELHLATSKRNRGDDTCNDRENGRRQKAKPKDEDEHRDTGYAGGEAEIRGSRPSLRRLHKEGDDYPEIKVDRHDDGYHSKNCQEDKTGFKNGTE